MEYPVQSLKKKLLVPVIEGSWSIAVRSIVSPSDLTSFKLYVFHCILDAFIINNRIFCGFIKQPWCYLSPIPPSPVFTSLPSSRLELSLILCSPFHITYILSFPSQVPIFPSCSPSILSCFPWSLYAVYLHLRIWS